MRRRFYLQLYAALLASAFVCLVAAAIAFRVLRESGGPPAERTQSAAAVLPDRVPDVHAVDARARLAQVADEFAVDAVAGDASGPLIAAPSPHGFAVPPRRRPGWHREPGGPVLIAALDGGGWVALRPRGPYRRLRMHPFFTALAVLAVVMAVGSYPVARRVTRRLEELARGVERWGRGDLGHRLSITGSDEVAVLAAKFNQAAERVDVLLGQQRQMLASASHELRSPLARLRMGLELMAEQPDATRRQDMVQQIHRDIVELDGLIEEVLLYARTDDRVPKRPLSELDLHALVAEEAIRTGASVSAAAEPPRLRGDVVLVRHMVRNLLENAQRHGGAGPVRASIAVAGGQVTLAVEDEGPGVPEEDREHIFAPFFRRTGGEGAPAGHGLGLALVRQVARYHGGEVAYRSRAGGGSRFEVTLPLNSLT